MIQNLNSKENREIFLPYQNNARYELWREQREWIEKHDLKVQIGNSSIKKIHPLIFNFFLKIANLFLSILKLKEIGRKNATSIKVNEISLYFPNLPNSFDNFRILQISDPHIDEYPEILFALLSVIPKEAFDLVVLTGDYADRKKPNYFSYIKMLEIIKKNIPSINGHVAVLGNHDSYEVCPLLRNMGITVLVNESIIIRKGMDTIQITGLDDVNSFYTSMASQTLQDNLSHFKILLVHSNEIAINASSAGFSLYLCGHCHGGQICFPNGVPIITQSNMPKKYFSGLWKIGQMIGYTSNGIGVVSLPYRFFSFPEITIFTLETIKGHS